MIQIQNIDGTFSVYEKMGEKPVKTLPTNREAIRFCLDQASPKKPSPRLKAASRAEPPKGKENS